jgi:multiple sugar transport system substrate-binding protein
MSRGSLSRRRFLYVSGAMAAGGALLAREQMDVAASLVADPAATISFWTPATDANSCTMHHTMLPGYKRKHPNVSVDIRCGVGNQDFLTVLTASIAAGNPPDSTVVWDPPITLAARGALEPLDDLMAHSVYSQAKNWYAPAMSSCRFKGKTYGFPASDDPLAFYYNVDMFEQKGIPTARASFPKTWDDLRKLSKEFTYWKGDQLVTAGVIPLNDGNWPIAIYVWAALNGGKLYDGDHLKYTIDADPNVAMMEYMVAWLNDEYKGDINKVAKSGAWGYWQPPGTTGLGPSTAFRQGKLAIVEGGSWSMDNMLNGGVAPVFHHYNAAPFPVGPGGTHTVSGTWPEWVAIPKGSHHLKEAFDWIDWVAGPGMAVWSHFINDLPGNKTAPTVLPFLTARKYGKAFATDMNDFFRSQQAIAIPAWDSPIQAFAQDQLQRAIDRIMHKLVKPKQGLMEAQQACQSQLQTALRSS